MTDEPDHDLEAQDVRARVLDAAVKLIGEGGVAALTTRAVASVASVQAPTLYRLFGEKRGLLNAVAEHALATFVAQKAAVEPHPDPVQDLSDAWDSYIAFGLANPAAFAIINELGVPTSASPAALAGIAILRERVLRIARAGRLAMPVERAIALIHAAGVGTVATLLALPLNERDGQLSSTARDAVLAAILAEPATRVEDTGIAPLAVALGSRLGEAGDLTPGERLLLAELLDRLSSSA
ncbi:TetR/AcrR family transcriptional regulator [Bradyrhizobium pachyrhizi]|uniref:TetR/AcrR family transcriptional regulator n=1 Tax=Bradyrhizobium pachyrhizi TaxID=280333 RepID=UPI003D36DB25